MEPTGIALITGVIMGIVVGHLTTMWWQVEPLREERDIWYGMYQDAWDYANSADGYDFGEDGDFDWWDDEDDELVTEARP